MGFVHGGGGEDRLIRGHHRQPERAGAIEQKRLRPPLRLRPMALQLKIKAVRKRRGQTLHQRAGRSVIIGAQRLLHHTVRAARERNQPLRVLQHPLKIEVGLLSPLHLQIRR